MLEKTVKTVRMDFRTVQNAAPVMRGFVEALRAGASTSRLPRAEAGTVLGFCRDLLALTALRRVRMEFLGRKKRLIKIRPDDGEEEAFLRFQALSQSLASLLFKKGFGTGFLGIEKEGSYVGKPLPGEERVELFDNVDRSPSIRIVGDGEDTAVVFHKIYKSDIWDYLTTGRNENGEQHKDRQFFPAMNSLLGAFPGTFLYRPLSRMPHVVVTDGLFYEFAAVWSVDQEKIVGKLREAVEFLQGHVCDDPVIHSFGSLVSEGSVTVIS